MSDFVNGAIIGFLCVGVGIIVGIIIERRASATSEYAKMRAEYLEQKKRVREFIDKGRVKP